MSPLHVARTTVLAAAAVALAGFAMPAAAQDGFSKADLYAVLRDSVPVQVCKTAPHVFVDPFNVDQAQCAQLLLQSLNFCIAFNDGHVPEAFATQDEASAMSNRIGKCAGSTYVNAMKVRGGG